MRVGDPERVIVRSTVSDRPVEISIGPCRTLLSALREELGLIGAKRGCGQGQCAACTVILGGETVIGTGSVIGGNVWLISSVAPYSKVYYTPENLVRTGGFENADYQI